MPRTVTTACPHCGLSVVFATDGPEQSITYDAQRWEKLCNSKEATSPALCLWRSNAMLPQELVPFVMRAVDAERRAPSSPRKSMSDDDAIQRQVSELFQARIRDSQAVEDIKALDAHLPDDSRILRRLGTRCLEEARKALQGGRHLEGRRLDILGRQLQQRADAHD